MDVTTSNCRNDEERAAYEKLQAKVAAAEQRIACGGTSTKNITIQFRAPDRSVKASAKTSNTFEEIMTAALPGPSRAVALFGGVPIERRQTPWQLGIEDGAVLILSTRLNQASCSSINGCTACTLDPCCCAGTGGGSPWHDLHAREAEVQAAEDSLQDRAQESAAEILSRSQESSQHTAVHPVAKYALNTWKVGIRAVQPHQQPAGTTCETIPETILCLDDAMDGVVAVSRAEAVEEPESRLQLRVSVERHRPDHNDEQPAAEHWPDTPHPAVDAAAERPMKTRRAWDGWGSTEGRLCRAG